MKHKVLSVKQPWSFLICSGIKDIENRSWKLPEKYKGERVLIHASGAKAQFNFSNAHYEKFRELNMRRWYDNDFYKSAIIGSVEIVDCVINHPSIWAEKTESIPTDVYDISNGLPAYLGKYNNNVVYNLVLANPILFDKPILNVKGKLGFWDYDLPEEYETILKL